jgi:hypothetical protein
LIVGIGALPADCLNAAPYTVSASKISVVNHVTGAAQIYTDNGDGKITLAINTNPVYIHYQP